MHVPAALKASAGREGVHAVKVNNVGPFRLVQSVSYLPGRKTERNLPSAASCASRDGSLSVEVLGGIPKPEAARACEQMLSGIEYVASFARGANQLKYRITLLPDGLGYENVHRALAEGSAEIAFGFRRSDSSDLSEAVDTVSHESVHILAGLLPLSAKKRRSESPAYLAGACARLKVTGVLLRRQVRFIPAGGGDSLPAAVAVSEREGVAAEERLLEYFGDSMEIRPSDPAGKRLMADCEESLNRYFSNRD